MAPSSSLAAGSSAGALLCAHASAAPDVLPLPGQGRQSQLDEDAVVRKGDAVMYRDSASGQLLDVVVESVDYALDPPSYTVLLNGTPRETERARLVVPRRT
eukprot:1311593-Rhodomonas_salina.1